jgi:hypothetical protein
MTKPHQYFLSGQTALTMVPAPVGREVRRAVPDHETPFFLSYARAKDGSRRPDVAHSSDQMTERFFRDLQEDIGQLISMRTGADIGFMDTGMRGGVRWVDELLHAAGTCQVLIALLSAPYLSCEWCGREWFAFKQRIPQKLPGTDASSRQGNIIPVIWAPVRFALPSPVSDEMIFSPTGDPDPDLPARYKANGVYGLMRMGREDSCRIITWQLAMLVSEVYYSQRLEVCEFQLEHLDNAFRGAPS